MCNLFTLKITSFVNKDSIYSFPVCIPFNYILFHWLGLPVWCWIEVMKADILACPDLRIGKQIVFHIIKGDVSYRFCIDDLVKFYYLEWMLNFVQKKIFFCINCYYLCFFLSYRLFEILKWSLETSPSDSSLRLGTQLLHWSSSPCPSVLKNATWTCMWLKKPNTRNAAQSVYALL